MREYNTVAGSAGFALAVIAFILTIGIIVLIICFCCQAEENKANHIRPKSQYTMDFSKLMGVSIRGGQRQQPSLREQARK